MTSDTNARYPRPLWDRAVAAYINEFCAKHDFDLDYVGKSEHSDMFYFNDMFCFSLYDIRLDIDGLDTMTRGHIDTQPNDIFDWYSKITGNSYRTFLLKRVFGEKWEEER